MIIDSPIVSGSYAGTGSFNQVGNVSISGSLTVTGSIIGNLTGTASYATTSSYALTASYAANVPQTSSYAISASYAINATSASYAANSTSASYAAVATTSSYTLTSSVSLEARNIVLPVKNVSGAQINKGAVVRINDATGDNALITLADWTNDGQSANTIGLVMANIPNDSFGYVMTEGTFLGYDTSTPGWVAGQLLYLGASGSITGSAPQAPLHGVRLGQVLRVQQINGSIYLRIDNGIELGEAHDVRDTTTTSSFGDLLMKSGSVWINSKQLTGSYGVTGSINVVGGITATNTITAQTLVVQTVTSSVVYSSGSNIFGNDLTNSQILTGSVTITGSLAVNGSNVILTNQTSSMSASYAVNSTSASFAANAANATSASYAASASNALAAQTASFVQNAQTASYWSGSIINAASASYALTASYAANVPQTASYAISASNAQTASYWSGSITNVLSASYAASSSNASAAASASYALTASYSANVPVTASYANNAATASYSLTSSYSLSGGGFPFSGSAVITGSLLITNLSGSGVRYVVTDANGLMTAQTASAAIKYNQVFTASAGQTTFTTANGYTTGYIDVFINGTKLTRGAEYTDTSGTNIVLVTGSMSNDIVELVTYLPASGVSNNVLRQLTTFTASAGQTVFSASYVPGLLDIFYNGSHLSTGDYDASNGTYFTLATASAAGDILDVFVYSYQVGAFSGIGGSGSASQIAYYSTGNSITGSPNFTISGSTMTVTGSLLVSGSGTFTNIGPAVFSGSITSTAGFTGSFSGTATSASYADVANSASYAASASNALAAQTASYVLNAVSASYVLNGVSASYAVSSSYALSASNAVAAQTASYANNLTVAGTLTAQTIVVQTITSSQDYVTGSTRFGSLISNTHTFTGSVLMTGSLTTAGQATFNGPSSDWAAVVQNSNASAGSSYGLRIKAGTSGSNDATLVLQDYTGSEYLTARGSGFIGIGTTSPSYKLDVQTSSVTQARFRGSSTDAAIVRFENSTGTNWSIGAAGSSNLGGAPNTSFYIRDEVNNVVKLALISGSTGGVNITGSLSLYGDGGVLNRVSSGEPYLFFRKDGVNRGSIYGVAGGGLRIFDNNDVQILTVTSSYVGIGTSVPEAKLMVAGGNGFIVDTENNTYGGVKIDTDSTGDYSVNIRAGRGGAAGGFRFFSNARPGGGGAFSTGNERFTILGTGNVGIGTTSPNNKLEVVTGTVSSYTGGGPGDQIRVSSGNTNVWISTNYNGTTAYFGSISDNTVKFAGYNYATPANIDMILGQDAVRIKSNGNIGIGVSNPAEKLDVYGNVKLYAGTAGSSPKLFFGGEASETAGAKAIYLESYWMIIQPHYNEGLRIRAVNASGTQRTLAEFYGSGEVYFASMASGAGTYNMRWSSGGRMTYDTSSERYKNNIRNSIYGLSDILKLKSRMFEYKDGGRTDVGLIAEEVNEIIPELAIKNTEGQPDAVSYDRMVSVLIKAVQEQQAQIEELKAKING